jgi:hypothetical protein
MKAHMLLCLLAAGCAADAPPAASHVPGIVVDNIGSTVSALSRENTRPCGYEHDEILQGTDQADQIIHTVAAIQYNAAGLDILEDERDDAGSSTYKLTSEYDAMGNTSHWLMLQPGLDQSEIVQEGRLAYDSFGRLIRYEIDSDYGVGGLNGTTTATYTYGDHDLRATAHLVRTDRPERSYDRTYTYDAQDRLIRLDRDFQYDGTIDESERYAYDDAAGTATMDLVDGAGMPISHTDYTYDSDEHLTKEATHQADATDIQDTLYEHLYDAGRRVADNQTYHDAATDNSLVFDTTENYSYQYSCR